MDRLLGRGRTVRLESLRTVEDRAGIVAAESRMRISESRMARSSSATITLAGSQRQITHHQEDMDPHEPLPPRPTVLRGASLVTAPFTLAGLVCLAMCAVTVTWVFGTNAEEPHAAWVTAIVFGVLGAALLVSARGCRVVLQSGRVTDQVAWCTVWSATVDEIIEVRVRSGPWRTFETEDDEGHRRVLLGTGPVQFPANLARDSRELDLAVIDKLRGSVRS